MAPVDPPPTAVLHVPSQAFAGDAVTFDGSQSTGKNGIGQYLFVFGDGTPETTVTTATTTHVYDHAGVFPLTLHVLDVAGTTSAPVHATIAVSVDQPPAAALSGPRSAFTGTAVSFDASQSRDPDSAIASYTFDFGDGTPPVTQAGPTATHAYTQRGRFTATVGVADEHGVTGTASASISTGYALSPPAMYGATDVLSQSSSTIVRANGLVLLSWRQGGALNLSQYDPGTGVATMFGTLVTDPYWSVYDDAWAEAADLSLHLVWEWQRAGALPVIAYGRTSDGRSTVSPPLILDYGVKPALATRGTDEILVSYCGTLPDTGALLTRSLDRGQTFSSPVAIGVDAQCPRLALGGADTVLVAAFQGPSNTADVVVYRSVDGGATFDAGIDVSNDPSVKYVDPPAPQIAADGKGTVVVFWEDVDPPLPPDPVELRRPGKLMMARSTDDGATWSPPVAVVDSDLGVISASVAFDADSNLYVAYSEWIPIPADPTLQDSSKMSYSSLLVSTDAGASFAAPIPLNEVPLDTTSPVIATGYPPAIALTWNSPLLGPLCQPWVTAGTVQLPAAP